MEKAIQNNWRSILVTVSVLLAVFVWPTRYKYLYNQIPGLNKDVVVRVDRFSGQVECWGIWYNIGSDQANMRWK